MTLHVRTPPDIDAPQMRPASARQVPNWGAFLARPIRLADGETVLERLWDAADILHARAASSVEFQLSDSSLMQAAATGKKTDISDATTHLERYLRSHALI